MGNDPFIDGLPIKNCDFPWLNNQLVYCKCINVLNIQETNSPSSIYSGITMYIYIINIYMHI
jgi:hypothetical protein